MNALPGEAPVIVYGANGFIGRNLVLALSSIGVRTIAVSRKFEPVFMRCVSECVDFSEADFSNTEELCERIFPRSGTTHVLLVSNSVPSTYATIPSMEISGNLLAHIRFLEHMRPDDRVVFLSSGGTVYGIQESNQPIKEDDIGPIPISAYGVTKLAIERYLAYAAHMIGFEYAIVRASNPVGPWTKPDARQGFLNVLLENYLAGLPTTIWGDGSTVRDFLDVRDLAGALIQIMQQQDWGNNTFNVGTGQGRSLDDVVRIASDILGIEFTICRDDSREVDVPYNVLDSSRIRQTIGWQPSYKFDTTVRDTWKFVSRRDAVTAEYSVSRSNTTK